MKSVVLLDRDGTINVDHGYVHDADQWEFIPGAVEAMARLREAGFLLAVVTNQSGIGTGRFKTDDVERLHSHMQKELRSQGVELTAVAFCPHRPDEGCGCRKPAIGMLSMIEAEIGAPIDRERSWMIGDKPSDIEFGTRAGVKTALLESQYCEAATLHVVPSIRCSDLRSAAKYITTAAPS